MECPNQEGYAIFSPPSNNNWSNYVNKYILFKRYRSDLSQKDQNDQPKTLRKIIKVYNDNKALVLENTSYDNILDICTVTPGKPPCCYKKIETEMQSAGRRKKRRTIKNKNKNKNKKANVKRRRSFRRNYVDVL